MQTVAFCEIDKFCQKVLKKHWPDVPIHEDITKLDGKQYAGAIDIICGGFPCQPFSVAGKQKGQNDKRHLWPEMFRVIQEAKPTWVIGENVAGFINMALDEVCLNLESEGFEVWPLVIPACAVDAPHRRNRVWIIAYSHRNRKSNSTIDAQERLASNAKHSGWGAATQQGSYGEAICNIEKGSESTRQFTGMGTPAFMANTASKGLEGKNRNKPTFPEFAGFSEWETEPTICGIDNGLSYRVDRLRALGNAVVPQIPEIIGRAIMENK